MSYQAPLLRVCLCLAALGPLSPGVAFAVGPAPTPTVVVPRLGADSTERGGAAGRNLDPLPGIRAGEPVSETNKLAPPTPTKVPTALIAPTARSDESVIPTATRPPATPTATARPVTPTTVVTHTIAPVPIAPVPIATAPNLISPVPTINPNYMPIVPQPIAGSPVPGIFTTPNAVRPGSSIGPLGTESTQRPAAGSPTPSTARSLRDQEPDIPALLISPTPEPTRTPTPLPPTRVLPTPTPVVRASPTVTTSGTVTATRRAASATATADIEDLATWEETISLVSIAPSALTLPPVSDGPTFVLAVPYRSQLDGTSYEHANCGPASLAMVMEAFGVKQPTSRIRARSNELQGTYGYDDGIALDYLAQIGDANGLETVGLYGQGGGGVFYNYKYWTVDEIREQVLKGRPVITLARYQALPGNSWSRYTGDHYIVITGLFGRNFVYNDAAFVGSHGYARLMSEETLLKVWNTSSIPHHAVAFAPGKQTTLKTVEINQSEAARAALLAIATAGEESLDLTVAPQATVTGTIGFGDNGQLQVFRRTQLGLPGESDEHFYGRADGLAGLLEASSPTEMRHLAPVIAATRPAAAAAPTVVADSAAEAATPEATEAASSAPAESAPAPAAPAAVAADGNPIQAFFAGVVAWFQSLTASLPILQARS